MVQNDPLLCAVAGSTAVVAAVFPHNAILRLFAIGAFSYVSSLIVYRLFFHPLSRFPGPKLAGLTYLYEFYYDVAKPPGGQYIWKLEELHKQYGPIIRITPDEVQISDPEFFDKVYASGSIRRNRWERAGTGKTSPGSMASAESHDLHRMRRNTLNNFFSKGAIMRLESRLQEKMKLLCQKLEQSMQRGEIFNVNDEIPKLTLSVITEYGKVRTWLCWRKVKDLIAL